MKWIYRLLASTLAVSPMAAQTYPGTYPEKHISNGVLTAKIYLPDAEKGFYRGTRFDWAGIIGSLEYEGHSYFGPFFEKFNPAVSDVMIGNPIEAGINSSASGPVEEFVSGPDGTVPGYADAKPGEAFCKIGVGALRKIDNAPYSSYTNYAIVNGGKRTVKSDAESIEFTQEVNCGDGYAYSYSKTVRLLKDEPVMTIEHRLLNTGAKPIETQVYDHNFLSIDHQPIGPDISVGFPFTPKPTQALDRLAEIRGKELHFSTDLTGNDTFYAEFAGFGKTAADYDMKVENQKVGAGVQIHGDQPLVNLGVWAVRTVVAPEPYIELNVPAGKEFSWKYSYRFYTIPGTKGTKR
ncbi:MAG: hypothetical protein WA477_17585 [Candidatus Sulfotelmatobacter sp.]